MRWRRAGWWWRLPVWGLAFACCGLPLAWLAWQVVQYPGMLQELSLTPYREQLLLRTIGYNAAVALLATVLAVPAALVLGRGRGRIVPLLWFFVPACLLMPSIAYAYGWSQFLRLLDVHPDLAGPGDVFRCIWSLATWLWAIPAVIIGLSLRRLDSNLQQHAILDGALWRITARQLAGAIGASAAIVMVLAVQEFAVYEPTGISVVATEVRMVYETGTFSAADNPMTVPGLGGTNAARDTQAAAAAGAVATSLPLLALVFALAAGSVLGGRRTSAAEALETGVSWPRVLDAGAMAKALAVGIVIVTLVVPTVSMILSLKRPFDLPRMYATFQPQLLGSLSVSAVTGVIAVALALWASVRRERVLLVLALAGFLVGGQLLAIAQIRLYNRPWLSWIYNAPPIIVMAYLARFGWVALAAGRTTWSSHAWRQLRDMAAVDGATVGQTARYVVWPLAWPVATAAGVLVMILSLTEVPATVLLAPQQPPLLVPLLMTWVHMLRYDDMLEGTLLLMTAVFVLTAVVVGLAALAVRVNGKWKMENGKWGSRTALFLMMLGLLVGGCFDGAKPEAVWGETGIGPAQVVYPRGISYSKQTDTFFVVDRMARIQQLDQKGECLSEWRMPQWQTGKPVGLTAGPDGLVYVADTHYHRVMVYQPDGTFVREWGTYGTGPGQFILPTDVAFDDKGNVFVAEYGDNDRIQVFDRDGTFLYEFGRFGQGDGELSRPQSIVIDAGRIYVADACNHRIAVFTTDGTFLRNMGSVGGESGQFRFPYGIDIDSRGRLVVCEFGNNRIQLVDKETGKGLETWGTGGRELGQLTYPWAVAVDKNDRVVAVDSGNNRLQVFEF